MNEDIKSILRVCEEINMLVKGNPLVSFGPETKDLLFFHLRWAGDLTYQFTLSRIEVETANFDLLEQYIAKANRSYDDYKKMRDDKAVRDAIKLLTDNGYEVSERIIHYWDK